MMKAHVFAMTILFLALATSAFAGGVSGQYIEARTSDVWVGECYANAEMNLTGKHAVIGWRIERGQEGNVSLDGLSVVAVVEATDTFGLNQTGEAKAVLLVDEKADASQKKALVALAKRLGGDLVKNVIAVEARPISLKLNCCEEKGCARLDAGVAKIATRCIHAHEDRVCGHEENYYPPLTKGLKVQSAMAVESGYTGKGFDKSWNDAMRRGAYVGTFAISE